MEEILGYEEKMFEVFWSHLLKTKQLGKIVFVKCNVFKGI